MNAGRAVHPKDWEAIRSPGAGNVIRLDGRISRAYVHRHADVPPAHRRFGLDEKVEPLEAAIHTRVPSYRPKDARFVFDHTGRHLLGIGRKDDDHLRIASGLAGLETHVEREARNPVDDELGRPVLEILDADADPAVPARVATTACRQRDLIEEIPYVGTNVEFELAQPPPADDNLFVHAS